MCNRDQICGLILSAEFLIAGKKKSKKKAHYNCLKPLLESFCIFVTYIKINLRLFASFPCHCLLRFALIGLFLLQIIRFFCARSFHRMFMTSINHLDSPRCRNVNINSTEMTLPENRLSIYSTEQHHFRSNVTVSLTSSLIL